MSTDQSPSDPALAGPAPLASSAAPVESAPAEPAAGPTQDPARRAQVARIAHYAALALVIGAGTAYRLYGLDIQSLWNDELSSWYRSEPVAFGEMWKRIVVDVHPAGYYLLLNLWQRLFGQGEITLRLLSALLGSATLIVAYRWGSSAGGARSGLLAAGMMAFAPNLLARSQSARPYALLVLFTILAGFAFHQQVLAVVERRRLPRRAVLLLGLWSAAMAHSHYMGVVFAGLAWAGLLAVMAVRRFGLHVLWGLLFGVALYAPWLPWFFADLARGGLHGPERLGMSDLLLALYPIGPRWISIACWALVPVAFVRILLSHDPERRRDLVSACFLLAWALVPLFAVFVKSSISQSLWTRRNLAPVHAAEIMLFAFCLGHLLWPHALRLRFGFRAALAALSLLLIGRLAYQPIGTRFYTKNKTAQFREAAAWVVKHQKRAPRAPIVSFAWQGAYFDYYFRHHGSSRRVDRNARSPTELLRALREQARGSDRIWLIAGHKIVTRAIERRIAREFHIATKARFHETSAFLLETERRPKAEASSRRAPRPAPPGSAGAPSSSASAPAPSAGTPAPSAAR